MQFYADSNFLSVGPGETLERALALARDLAAESLFVVGTRGELVGALECAKLEAIKGAKARKVAEVLQPAPEMPSIRADADLNEARRIFFSHPRLRCLPVLEEERLVGVLLRSSALSDTGGKPPGKRSRPASPNPAALLDLLLRHAPSGLFIVAPDDRLALVNSAFEACFGIPAQEALGQPFGEIVGPAFASSYSEYLATNPVTEARRTGRPLLAVERRAMDGRSFLVDCVPLPDASILVTLKDITPQKDAERALELSWGELEQAFALMLPNSKVERKLKSSPEYRDEYDPATGRVHITGVIPDGTYRHVINALKVASDLKRAGAMEALGIDKDTVVQTMMYHDLGKIQPWLQVGAVLDPREAFEPSKLHAQRSADFAAGTYVRDEDTLALIRHHHHEEHELPPEFPRRLLPMLRLVRLIDGLSAAVTRKDAHVTVRMEHGEIVVDETNPHSRYNGTHRIDLFGGSHVFTPAPAAPAAPTTPAR